MPKKTSTKPGLAKIDESDLKAHLERALNAPLGHVRVWRQNSGTLVYTRKGFKNAFRGAPEGSGDLVGYVVEHEIDDGTGRGRRCPAFHLEVETKALKGKLRTAQIARQKAAQKAGWPYVVVSAGADLKTSVGAAVEEVNRCIRVCERNFSRSHEDLDEYYGNEDEPEAT